MAQVKLSEKRKKKIIADYAVEGSYRAAARKNGVSPNTVRRLVLADPESARAAQDKKGACARYIELHGRAEGHRVQHHRHRTGGSVEP